ncbi:MAG: hypothetical protein JWO68_3995 [Actinomycetia bacterium]|nr:hypothetical protein [Actinomycetes bacterium]
MRDVRQGSMRHSKQVSLVVFIGIIAAFAAAANESVDGMWSSASRTKGGLGSQWVFETDGTVAYTFGALVDFKYEINGRQLRMTLVGLDAGRTPEVSVQSFSMDGDSLILSPEKPDQRQVMKRLGVKHKNAHEIVGEWTYLHYTGVPAFMRFSSRGLVQLAVPMQSVTGAYRLDKNVLRIELKGQKPSLSTFRRDKDALILIDSKQAESKFQRFNY